MSALSITARSIIRQKEKHCPSNANIRATVFGATGFLGHAVCDALGYAGMTLNIPYRGDEDEIRFLKPISCSNDLGMITFSPFNIRDRESVRKAVKGSDIVINLIGKHYETKHFFPWWINYTYDDVNVHAAKKIAEICSEENIPRLIHHSSCAATPNSPSIWAASKYRGEMAVKNAFPQAVITRSSLMFGQEDRFLTWFANRIRTGGIPLVEDGASQVQPVFVNDVAKAIKHIVIDTSLHSKTFEFHGDETYTYKEIADIVLDLTKARNKNNIINLPLNLAKVIGQICELFPDPRFTKDMAVLFSIDYMNKNSHLNSLRELEIIPTSLEKEASEILNVYDRAGHFQRVSGYH